VLSRQVHRVRSALDDGLPDDPELTGDLTVPIQAIRQDSGYDDGYTRSGYTQEPRSDTIVVPFQPEPPVPPRRTGSAPPRMQPRSRWRGLVALFAVLAVAIGVGTTAWYYGVQRYTATPTLVNMRPTDATAKAAEVGLTTKLLDQTFSEVVPKGFVVSTDPAPGDRVRKGGVIGLIVSKGQERYRVPQLAGLELDAAKRALDGIKLVTGRITETYSETLPAGRIVSYLPKFDTVMKPGNTVTLWVSLGKKPITVQDMTGKPVKDATRTLRKAGFVVQRTDVFNETVPEGRVISQTPNSGSRFAKDSIQLVVSKGPALRDVPNVKRKQLADARKILTAAGFVVKVEQAPFHLGLNLVAGQSPKAGLKAKPGSTVIVTIL